MLEPLNAMITNALGPAGPLIAVAALAAVLILATLPALFNSRPDPMDRLKQSGREKLNADTKAVLREKHKSERLNKYAQFLEPQNEEELSAVRKKLQQAGYRRKDAVQLYYFAQVCLGLGGFALGILYFLTSVDPAVASMQQKVMYILMPGAIGYFAPKYWVTRRSEERKQEIQDGFPDALDMMLVCVEAGQSMEQSIVRVAKELRGSYPALSEEFEMITYEIKAGKDRATVLNDMADRCDVQDVASFVTVLNQAQSFGTSFGDALRVYASEMRDKRVMRAEEKANQLPTKMTLTTMMLTVPPLLLILVGPSAVGITQLGNL
jgi:tight adherence protein C